MSEELCYLTAVDALDRFRAGDISPVEVLEAQLARAEEVEPEMNAFVWTRFDEARADARASEARYRGKGDPPRPLEGLTYAVKDETPIAGQPYSMGSLVFADDVAAETSPFAQRVLDAGVVLHASTATPEFSAAAFTHTRLNGVTRNPWNLGFGVGGSSGGTGAALAAGTTTLAAGSDIGGSIRIPAGFCGVVGFKAPQGRVPCEPPFNLDHYCHNGALARTVADCALLHNVMAGPHPMDHWSLPKVEIPATLDGVQGLRIALSPGLGAFPLDPEVDANTRAAAAALADAGAIVREVDLAIPFDELRTAMAIHFNAIFTGWIAGIAAEHRELLCDYSLVVAETAARDAAGHTVLEGLELEASIWHRLAAVFADHDLLLCATQGTRGLVAGDGYADHGLTVGGVELDDHFDAFLTPVFNVASKCPVLNVPSGFADNGVPTGLQIVGRPYDDVTPFRAGAALEAVRPLYDAPERRPRWASVA